MKPRPLYQEIASLVMAMRNCEASGNTEWLRKHRESALELVKEHMPSGSGIDSGTEIDLDRSSDTCLVFTTSFHHMNDGGMYDGWTEHTIKVRPSLAHGFAVSVSGRDRNQIKDYLADTFRYALETRINEFGNVVDDNNNVTRIVAKEASP